ncbi:DUF1353 domain-containing protein [Leisingera sp. MMG026]|uniref:DUF1353 domain-containing protein n=1 Tax=Leisingera sp. MMG026 TaxID=2909982 RepID=UPI001F264ADB|nr:DUF1353 domain-containing protein [Leisingera sp. MMG026]MCF6432649.1 DUF1353 domain-containing protein [Leisingera sp. MMG026]
MSSFTRPLKIVPVPEKPTGWRKLLPPGWHTPAWEVAERFEYAVGSLDQPAEVITVLEGFRFDGASVPLLLRLFVPMAHPNYVQATALHDWMLEHQTCSRWHCDRNFREALGVLGMPALWRILLHRAVNTATIRWHVRQFFKAGGRHAG